MMLTAEGNGGEDVFFVARNNDSDRDLAVVGAIGRVESAAAGVEADLSAKMAEERGLEGARVEMSWGSGGFRHRSTKHYSRCRGLAQGQCEVRERQKLNGHLQARARRYGQVVGENGDFSTTIHRPPRQPNPLVVICSELHSVVLPSFRLAVVQQVQLAHPAT